MPIEDDERRRRARERLQARRAASGGEGSADARRRSPGASRQGAARPARPASGTRPSGEARRSRPPQAVRGGSPRRTPAAQTPSRLLLLAVAALAVLLVLFLAVKGCASCSASDRDGADGATASVGAASSTQNDDGQEGDTGSADSASEDEPVYAGAPLRQSVATGGLVATYLAPIDYDSLSYLVGDAFAAQLVAVSAYDMNVRWIISNIDAYAMDGEAVQAKLLKLAAKEPEAVDFVRRFPASYPMDQGEPCTETADGDRPPLLYQWDRKWGYTVYSSTAFALTGCCPTSLAMVYQGLTGKTDLSPYDMGVIAQRDGYMTEYNGTDARYLVNEAPSLGLTCNEVPADADEITAALSNGALVIANMAPGDFTEGGHFIVLASLDDSGNVVVNDPYSAVRSAKTWSPSLIADQAISLYVYYAA